MTARPEHGLGALQKLRFVLANEALWELGEAAPRREPGSAGAPRHYPEWVWYLYCASVSIYLSARKAAAELDAAWPLVMEASRTRYPDRSEMWAPAQPPSRHHWQYSKKRLRLEPVLKESITTFEAVAAMQAIELGLAGPNLGSVSHPDPLNTLYGDGKVITPMYRAKRRAGIYDRDTGERLGFKKADPDAIMHTTGGGLPAYGNKMVFILARRPGWHGRMVLSIDHVATKGGEAGAALNCVERIRPRLPGAQAFAYDGALRGMHVRRLLRDMGLVSISPPTAARAETDEHERVEKVVFIETIAAPDGDQVSLYGKGGQIGVGEFDADGNETFLPLARQATKRRQNSDGTFRWYGLYRLPDHLGGMEFLLRADTTEADVKRKINRSENFRLIPPGDPDYAELYPLRADSEANNRQLEDTLWINRAHSVGARAQLLDLLGYSLVYNSVAIGLAREQSRTMAQAA